MQNILDLISAGAPSEEFAALELPESYRAVVVRKEEQDMFAGMESGDKDPRQALHLQDASRYR